MGIFSKYHRQWFKKTLIFFYLLKDYYRKNYLKHYIFFILIINLYRLFLQSRDKFGRGGGVHLTKTNMFCIGMYGQKWISEAQTQKISHEDKNTVYLQYHHKVLIYSSAYNKWVKISIMNINTYLVALKKWLVNCSKYARLFVYVWNHNL